MKERILLLFVFLAATALTFSPPCSAYASVAVYGYTDRTYYKPGDTGTLRFSVYNAGTDDLILKNLTIYYPWYNIAGLWEGNETIVPSAATVIPAKGSWNDTASFTVPDDGRAAVGSSSIRIDVVTDKITQSSHITLNVANVPAYFYLQGMDQLTTLMTILVVLIIVCTVIIAAAIFLSTRERHTMWKPEEKAQ